MAHNLEKLPMTLDQLLSDIAIMPKSVGDISMRGLSIDSRCICDGYVFVAMEGVEVHGKEYIPQAVAQGAIAVFVEAEAIFDVTYQYGIPVLEIPQLSAVLSHIAGQFYGHPTVSVNVLGITGTNGKTTCSQLYAQLLALTELTVGVIGTNGYGLCVKKVGLNEEAILTLDSTGMTTPDAISSQALCVELVAAGGQDLVMEVSSHGLEQNRVAAIHFDGAVFTNLSHDHLDYHGDMAAYGAAKAKLFTMPSITFAVINIDDPFAETLLSRVASDVRVVTYSVLNPQADMYLSNISYNSTSTQALLHANGSTYTFSTRLVGQFNLSNLMAILGALYPESTSDVAINKFEKMISLVKFLAPVSGRMESIENRLGKQVLVDFAHTPDALENVLQAIREYSTANIYCVFGCGGDRDKQKRALMARIAETYADCVIVTSDNPRREDPQSIVKDICEGFSKSEYHIVPDREEAITMAITQSSVNDVVLVAGKGHESYQLIGDTKIPFSDQSVARLALRKMEAAHND
jgi:UDP-N-acetylmuramoyl-L-alanyl-D-glutamate--2,6-diaminopimelate ligase